jgi:putative ABC transport system permease protein
MLFYNIRIAAKSLRRNPILTTLLIGAIALGICVSTSFVAMRHMLSKDPLPGKSDKLFYIRLDSWDPGRAYVPEEPKSIPMQVTYRDARDLMRSTIPTRQTASFKSTMFVFPDPKVARPYNETIRLVGSDFFPMFQVPFQYGAGWDKAADAKPEQVVVLDAATNKKLYGGANSVGKSLRIEDRNYRVVGVIDEWRPNVKFYDLTQNATMAPEGIFMPFNLTPILQPRTSGNTDGWKSSGTTPEEFLQSETTWIQFWVELPEPQQQSAYRDLLVSHMREQKKFGRFQRPLYYKLTNVTDLMKEFNVVPRQVHAMSIVSLLFLAVCSLNLVGLLLGKFLARVPEVSVRRALGASRLQIFWQHIVECELVGVVGGLIGLVMSFGLLKLIGKAMPEGMLMPTLDLEMLGISAFLSLVAGLMAGIYPAWRVCTVPPAMQLKVQ